MNHELAKELKDAGFPQKGIFNGVDGWIVRDGTLNGTDIVNKPDEPTLSELIAACPTYLFDEEFNLHATHEEGKIKWCACYIRPSNLNESAKHLSIGSTHEEAVARLYLALNKPAG